MRRPRWERLGTWRYWWVPLAVAFSFLFAGSAALTALSRQLGAMHLPGVAGRGPQGFLARSQLDLAVRQWFEFWASGGRVQHRFVSPLWLSHLYFLLDYLLFIPGYVVATVVVMARNRSARIHRRRDSLARLTSVASVAILVGAVFDCLENALSLVLIGRSWSSGGTRPRSWQDGLLTFATRAKVILVAIALVSALILAIIRWRERRPRTRAAIRLLRTQIGVVVGMWLLFSVPIQLGDLIVRTTPGQAFIVLAAALVLATIVWSTARLMVTGHESREPTMARRRPGLLAVGAAIVPLAVVSLVNAVSHADPIAPWVPVILGAAIWLLGLLVPTEPLRPDDAPRSLGVIGFAIPQILAAAALAVGGSAVVRTAVGSYVQRGPILADVVIAAGLFTLSLLALFVIFELESALSRARAVARHGGPRGYLLLMEARRRHGPRRTPYLVAALVAGAITAVAAAVLLLRSITVAQRLGSLTVVLVFAAAATLVLAGLVSLAEWWADRFGEPRILSAVDLRRIPVITLLVVWAILASLVDDGSHWNVRTVSATGPEIGWTRGGVTLQAAFRSWLTAASTRAGSGGGRRPIPMVFVATSGGGIRAAYWTALAMDCLFGGHEAAGAPERSDPCALGGPRAVAPQDVFVASGASGGSVGLVEWDASRDLNPYSGSWVEDHLGEDFVSPTLARGLLSEVPRSFLHFATAGRDDVLEQAWERPWDGGSSNPMTTGYLADEQRRMGQGGPFLILNGSSVADGCSLNVSILDVGSTVDQGSGSAPPNVPIGDCHSVTRYTNPGRFSDTPGPLPAVADLVDYLGCPDAADVRRSTAALLSARFPFVSAAGRLQGCGGTASTKYIDDGGLVDNSGAESALTVWLSLEPRVQAYNQTNPGSCIVPYFVQLDNGYDPATSPRNRTRPPNQLFAPLQSLLQGTGTGGRQARARDLAADLFTQPFGLAGPASPGGPADRYAILFPTGHPGLEAPLGWTLSAASRRDLEDELYSSNANQIAAVRGWLSSPAACPPLGG